MQNLYFYYKVLLIVVIVEPRVQPRKDGIITVGWQTEHLRSITKKTAFITSLSLLRAQSKYGYATSITLLLESG
jgi:hypothetical protein